ncbi:hypothetical protein K458DRAFT_106099 [Lentithecium fluviatile CBS 122367]|uniref:Cryptic loci regulator 2 N-terminal domain-containing protein n=1 Tax=Lentithecium fluviatile CBS 122367 TaxID=1168545 RepID=A0A6G1JJT4_9PLEO|nr:hypothetical protein K458DRAFT_106099 [Lentithecium fluviatile CBS 122367]
MAQPLTQFWPIFAGKSDGQDVVNQKGVVLRNGPTQEQLDRTPNEQGQSDYYRLIEKDEPKHTDWRKKLGGMLLREVGGKEYEDKWTQCILWDFPEGYRLYEHIKSKANGEAKAVKNHSGGGHDRQDAYLYGYPKGPRKRFRSPIEFFPHLLWLSTDETSDYQNCTCRICSPMQMEVEKPAPAAKPELKPDLKKENGPMTAAQTVGRNPVVQIPMRRPSTGTPMTQSPSTKPATPSTTPNPGQIRAPPRLEPTPLPQPRNIDQQVDSQYGKFVARTGEVVWFFRPSTEAWGLGLVVRRWLPKDKAADRCYYIQPLSHPFSEPPQEMVTSDQNLKPWLAWSAPSCTYAYLQQNPTLRYDQIDWHSLLSGRFGEGVADVDASILAAKAIDTTYTLFECLKTATHMGVEERHYNGIYLGAEKIWNGEPVRLRMAIGTDVLVVTSIIEKLYPGPPNQANAGTTKIELRGDVYSYDTLPAPNPNSLPQAPSSSNIPLRMREDLRWRNHTLVPTTRLLAYWKLMRANVSINLEDIKGRWYETSILFVEFFTKAIKNNEGGNGVWMNARGDATGVGKAAGTQQANRIAAFGPAVPKSTHLTEGLDVPDEQGKSGSAAMPGMELGVGAAGNEGAFQLDDFMNFDGTEDAGMTFGQGFTF